MSAISYADILKRDNANLLVNRAMNGKFVIGTSNTGNEVVCKGKIRILDTETTITSKNIKSISDAITQHCKTAKKKKIEIFTNKNWILITKCFKDSEFSGMKPKAGGTGGKSHAERQERGLVTIINEATMSGPIQIQNVTGKISGAGKVEGLSKIGQEPYTDIYLLDDKKKKLNVSCKGPDAPSLGGGGLKGLLVIVPDVIKKLYESIQKDLSEMGFVDGEEYTSTDIPDLFYELPSSAINKIFVGNEKMGGPIHYMYIGPMDVTYNNGKFNGEFIEVMKYAKKYKFMFRLRKRDVGAKVRIDFKSKDRNGLPPVYKTGSKTSSRLVVTNSAPKNNTVRTIR